MALTLANAPIPVRDPISVTKRTERYRYEQKDPLEGHLTNSWIEWFTRLNLQVNSNPTRLNQVNLTAQSATIAATDFSGGSLNQGLYRLSYYTRITTAAGTSSSLTITLSWTESGVAMSSAGAAITGNTITTFQSGTILVFVDSAAPVRYSTTYVSVGAPSMVYRASFVIEAVQT